MSFNFVCVCVWQSERAPERGGKVSGRRKAGRRGKLGSGAPPSRHSTHLKSRWNQLRSHPGSSTVPTDPRGSGAMAAANPASSHTRSRSRARTRTRAQTKHLLRFRAFSRDPGPPQPPRTAQDFRPRRPFPPVPPSTAAARTLLSAANSPYDIAGSTTSRDPFCLWTQGGSRPQGLMTAGGQLAPQTCVGEPATASLGTRPFFREARCIPASVWILPRE